jgi:hypothetical protein
VGAQSRPTSKGTNQEILLIDGGQDLSRGALKCPVGYTRDTQ